MMIMIECHGGCHCCLFVGTGRRKPPASHLYSTLLFSTLSYCTQHESTLHTIAHSPIAKHTAKEWYIYCIALRGSDVELYIVAALYTCGWARGLWAACGSSATQPSSKRPKLGISFQMRKIRHLVKKNELLRWKMPPQDRMSHLCFQRCGQYCVPTHNWGERRAIIAILEFLQIHSFTHTYQGGYLWMSFYYL